MESFSSKMSGSNQKANRIIKADPVAAEQRRSMDIKEYLRGIRKLYLEIEAKRRQRERLYCTVTGSSLPIKTVDVQTSVSGDRLGDTMAEVADLDRSIRQGIASLCKQQAQAVAIIAQLSKPEYRAVMTDYYINAYTWARVADLNGYSEQAVYKIHGEALNELRENGEK